MKCWDLTGIELQIVGISLLHFIHLSTAAGLKKLKCIGKVLLVLSPPPIQMLTIKFSENQNMHRVRLYLKACEQLGLLLKTCDKTDFLLRHLEKPIFETCENCNSP